MPDQLTIYRCAFCGGFLPKGRTDRRYCSDACKQRAYRWRNRLERYTLEATNNIANVGSYATYPEAQKSAIEALAAIKKSLDETCRQYNIRIKSI